MLKEFSVAHFTIVKSSQYLSSCSIAVMNQNNHTTHAKYGLTSVNLRKETIKHTLRCLLGCNIGEITGMVVGFHYNWDFTYTLILAVSLAFATGYAFTIIPMLKTLSLKQAARVAIVGDTASIASMEFAENTTAILIPGFMGAHLFGAIFWMGLAIILPVGFLASYPIMYWAMKKEVQKGKEPSCH
ncbi:MAG: DUF4396 domain-containing protein [Nitrosopumilus sp.]|nr:DUF4396 domain-containing protein [Nitrosopumilus sp.]